MAGLLDMITDMLPPEMQAELKNQKFQAEIQKTLGQFQMQDDPMEQGATFSLGQTPETADILTTDDYVQENTKARKAKLAKEKEQKRREAESAAASGQADAESLTSGSASQGRLRGMRSGFSKRS